MFHGGGITQLHSSGNRLSWSFNVP